MDVDLRYYLDVFQKVSDQLDQKQLIKNRIETTVGIFLESVVLKMYKRSWANPLQDPITSESRIFFSVWMNDSAIKDRKLFYNIHALKLRKLKGYVIESRKFAETFRAKFKKFEYKWENVSVKFGPLTLMEGWVTIDLENFEDQIMALANNFLEIQGLVDETLVRFEK